MKLTEKELNEFPIGTKITTKRWIYIKLGENVFKSNIDSNSKVHTNSDLIFYGITRVEIPTYTEYIPPKPILDDKEKEYLSNVIRPFRDGIKSIQKKLFKEEEYIFFNFNKFNDNFELPSFKIGTMYKGMELDREYTLEELGL